MTCENRVISIVPVSIGLLGYGTFAGEEKKQKSKRNMAWRQVSATRADDVIMAPTDLHKSLPLFVPPQLH